MVKELNERGGRTKGFSSSFLKWDLSINFRINGEGIAQAVSGEGKKAKKNRFSLSVVERPTHRTARQDIAYFRRSLSSNCSGSPS